MTTPRYSPSLRTALVLTGSGTAGAYHAGVLRALCEAGVKIDLVAGRGIGAVGAMFAAVDGGATLWDPGGVWQSDRTRRAYGWRRTLKAALWTLAASASALLVPLTALVGAAIVYPVGFLLRLGGFDAGTALAAGYTQLVDAVFHPAALPLYLPRVITLLLVVFLGVLVVGEALPRFRVAARRRARGLVWWRLLGAPLEVATVVEHFTDGLWSVMRGAARVSKPPPRDLAERYTELLSENVGQPGFRELLVVAHDLDTRRDLVFGLLADERRRPFFVRRIGSESGDRHLETMDLAGPARIHCIDAITAALCLPVATDAHPVRFAAEHRWRGETHRLCDRPEATGRLLEEVANAGAEQVILVTALPESRGPFNLESGRRDPRERAAEYLASVETAALRDALVAWGGHFQAVFHVRPEHNPIGPLDFDGAYDERSDRMFPLSELIERGREDGFRQFVDAVVGASGEWIQVPPRRQPESGGSPQPLTTSGSDS